jgi:hypothetical protein
MTTIEMLERLQHSQNKIVASLAERIIEGKETIKEAQTLSYGGFVNAVLNGNYQEALERADLENLRLLRENEDFYSFTED